VTAAIVLAGLAFLFVADSRNARALVVLAALAIAVSGAIGVYHATEQGPDGSKFPSQQPQMSGSLA